MGLSDLELERYARHIILPDIGGPGQAKLKAANILVIGAGGLGAPVLMYLAAAGVGRLGIADDDVVSLSNLQRQIIHDTDQIGTPKTTSAAQAIARINPHTDVQLHQTRLDEDNILEIVEQYDLVVDGCDNFKTRFLVADACYLARKTLISGAVGQFDGQVSTFKPHLKRADGTPYPTYRCLLGGEINDGQLPTCEEAGIIGALTGIIGSIAAMEAIKEITGAGDGLAGHVFFYDALSVRAYKTQLNWDPANPVNGENAQFTVLSQRHGWPDQNRSKSQDPAAAALK